MKNSIAFNASNKLFLPIEKVFSDKSNPSFAIQIPVTNSSNGATNPLHCFYTDYKKLGGSAVPKEVLNMAIQQINSPQTIAFENSIKLTIFQAIAEQVFEMGITSQKDVWRIADIYTQNNFGYKINFLKWQYYRLLSKLF